MQHYLFMACTSFPYTDGGIGKTNGLMMCNNFTAALIYQEMQLFAPNLAKVIAMIFHFNLKCDFKFYHENY